MLAKLQEAMSFKLDRASAGQKNSRGNSLGQSNGHKADAAYTFHFFSVPPSPAGGG
jgi:hypothetical protein